MAKQAYIIILVCFNTDFFTCSLYVHHVLFCSFRSIKRFFIQSFIISGYLVLLRRVVFSKRPSNLIVAGSILPPKLDQRAPIARPPLKR